MKGPDAADFLQRMSTQSFKAFDKQRALPGGFLTGRAGVVALGWFLAGEANEFHFIVGPQLLEKAKAHIEMFHFNEKLTVEDQSGAWAVFGLWSPSDILKRELGIVNQLNPLQLQSPFL